MNKPGLKVYLQGCEPGIDTGKTLLTGQGASIGVVSIQSIL
jgi:hypothetical protein